MEQCIFVVLYTDASADIFLLIVMKEKTLWIILFQQQVENMAPG